MIKHPAYADRSKQDPIGDGTGGSYVYVTSSSSSSWAEGSKPVTDSSSLLGKQLAGVYDHSVENYVFYNDQLPNGSWTTTYGHSKGFFAWDGTTGYWVQHSIPKFPNFVSSGYEYGHSQELYGQHAFCMTLTSAMIDEAAAVMLFAHPWVYDSHVADTSLANVNDVVGLKKKDGTVKATIKAAWGDLTLLGKSSSYGQDMLDTLVAPALDESVESQSWLNSGGPIGGYCPSSGDDVLDIETLHFPPSDTHVTAVDHSKWAVAKSASVGIGYFWCALDNNHVASQETRSGLAVCQTIGGVASLLRAAATEVGPCGAPPPPPTPGGSCCYYHDATCTAGQICCSGSGKSYTSASTCARYGTDHGCVWDAADDKCWIPSAAPPSPALGLAAGVVSKRWSAAVEAETFRQ